MKPLILVSALLSCAGTSFAYGQSDEIRGQLAAVVGTFSVQAAPQIVDCRLELTRGCH